MGARYRPTLPTLAVTVVTVLSLVAAFLLGSATPAAAQTKPVINGPVFNDPLGTAAQQKAIFTQLVRLIDATPAGATIRGSMYEFNDQEVANALLAAHRRGVNVRLIVDDSTYVSSAGGPEYTNVPYRTLRAGLGTNDSARSWIVVCDDRFEDADGVDDVQRGCLAVAPPQPAYNHNKFFIFSRVGPFDDGTGYSRVVFHTSSNLSDWYKVESFNDAVTFVSSAVYNGYASYHEQQRQGRRLARGNNNAYFSTPTGSTYRGFFYPRGDSSYNNPATDTIVGVLNEISCAYTGTDGLRHQTAIRIVTHSFLGSRRQVPLPVLLRC
ncbi:phospholipase D-like domain-containing protein [Streptomyces sp. NPDC006356]